MIGVIIRSPLPRPKRARQAGLALAALALAPLFAPSPAAQVPIAMNVVADQFVEPTFVTHRPGDTQTLFVAEIGGTVRLVRNGTLAATPYLDISSKVVPGFEQGLLCIAFHPGYPATKRLYVAYTDLDQNTVVESYDEDPNNASNALPSSAQVVLGPIVQPGEDHNGGCLAFGPDGMLYIGMGDGGSPNDTGPGHVTGGNAQSLATVLGSILRLDVDLPFPHIPATNPFVSTPGARGEIWALGLRNPWRFSFDRATGDLYVGDVGQDTREEISVLPAGAAGLNLGWRCREGDFCTGLSGCVCDDPTLLDPAHQYGHNTGCSVIGGFVYRGCAIPSLDGHYFFSDYCSALTWSFVWNGSLATNLVNRTNELGVSNRRFSSYGEDALGEIYALEYERGELWKLEPAQAAPDCDTDGIPDSCAIATGLDFDLDGNGVPDSCEGPACSLQPTPFCTNSNSLDCPSVLQASGTPSATNPAPFLIVATAVMSQRPGVLLYGQNEASLPFNGGTLCVGSPASRSVMLHSAGSAVLDCSGEFSLDFNALIQSGVNSFLLPGARLHAQYLYRDPFGAFDIGLSPAVKFDICP